MRNLYSFDVKGLKKQMMAGFGSRLKDEIVELSKQQGVELKKEDIVLLKEKKGIILVTSNINAVESEVGSLVVAPKRIWQTVGRRYGR